MTYPAPDKVPHDDWFTDEPPDLAPSSYEPPDARFENPLDSMPIAKDPAKEVSMHEKMYRMATARYNPFSIGGSENCHADIDCPTGGSEAAWHVPPRPEEKVYDELNDPYGGY